METEEEQKTNNGAGDEDSTANTQTGPAGGDVEEINANLKTKVQSAITDLEQDLDKKGLESGSGSKVGSEEPIQEQDNKENVTNGSHNGGGLGLLEQSVPAPQQQHNYVRLRLPHEFKPRPNSMPPNAFDNYQPPKPISFPEIGKGGRAPRLDVQDGGPAKSASEINGFQHQLQQQQDNAMKSQSHGSIPFNKAMQQPQNGDYDTSSLKRRNPRQMYTDSAFYSPQHHPSVAEQVEMAHKLSSSLYDEGNKMSKGQEMYLKRAKKSGKWVHHSQHRHSSFIASINDDSFEQEDVMPRHDPVPNMKLVMNPEGKLHDWTDLPPEELPEMQVLAAGGLSPDTAHHVVENLQSCKGRGGQLFAKRKDRAEKWVVDENSLGTSEPSQYADRFIQQQSRHQERIKEEKERELQAKFEEQQRRKEEAIMRQQERQRAFQQHNPGFQPQQQQQVTQYQSYEAKTSYHQQMSSSFSHAPPQTNRPDNVDMGPLPPWLQPEVQNPPPAPQQAMPYQQQQQQQQQQQHYPQPQKPSYQPRPASSAHQFLPKNPPQYTMDVRGQPGGQRPQPQQRQPQQQQQQQQTPASQEPQRQKMKKKQEQWQSQQLEQQVQKQYQVPDKQRLLEQQQHQEQQQEFVPQQQQQPINQPSQIEFQQPQSQPQGQGQFQEQIHRQEQQEYHHVDARGSTSAGINMPREVELPAHIQKCSLKGSLAMPEFDTSIHNVQGIDVWAYKKPKSWSEMKSNTLPRNRPEQTSLLADQRMPAAVEPQMESKVFASPSQSSLVRETQDQPDQAQAPKVEKEEDVEFSCSIKYEEKQSESPPDQDLGKVTEHETQEPNFTDAPQQIQPAHTHSTIPQPESQHLQEVQRGEEQEPSIETLERPEEEPEPEQQMSFEAEQQVLEQDQPPQQIESQEEEAPQQQEQEEEPQASPPSRVSSHHSIPRVDSHHSIPREGSQHSIARVDSHKSVPRADSHHSIPRVDSHQSIPRVESHQSVPRVDSLRSVPRADSQKSIPRVDSQRSIPRVDSHHSVTRVDSHHSVTRVESLRSVGRVGSQQSIPEQQRVATPPTAAEPSVPKAVAQPPPQQPRPQPQPQAMSSLPKPEPIPTFGPPQQQQQKQQPASFSYQHQEQRSYQFSSQQQQFSNGHGQGHVPEPHQGDDLSMQVKTGGVIYDKGNEIKLDDYIGSLKPTTTGALIRAQGDVVYTQAGQGPFRPEEEPESYMTSLRPTQFGQQLRETGQVQPHAADSSSIDYEQFDNERHSVKNLVQHFRAREGNSGPVAPQSSTLPRRRTQSQPRPMSQHYPYEQQQQQQQQQPQYVPPQQPQYPPQQQPQPVPPQPTSSVSNRSSMAEFLSLDTADYAYGGQNGLNDPSAILGVDGAVLAGHKGRGREQFPVLPPSVEPVNTKKWDNHNAIPGGWRGQQAKYQPVTFRKLYGAKK